MVPGNGGRRSSLYSGHRHSSMGGPGFGVLSQNAMQAPSKDPRPVREKAFKEACMQTIIRHLNDTGYAGQATTKTLTTPTQKEFVAIFQHLYHEFDPNFQFVRKLDEDVLACIKALRYPFAESIPRSQLSAVGSPHSWPNMLAMLSWMCETLDMTAALTAPPLQNPDKTYFDHYLTRAYQLFLAGSDDFGLAERDLEAESDRQNEAMLAEIERLGDVNDRLERELQALRDSQPPLRSLEREYQVLQSDKAKFRDYIARLDAKREKLVVVNEKIREQLREAEAELDELASRKTDLQSQVDAQDISAADVEKMTSEHENLIKNLDTASQQSQDISNQLFEQERAAQAALDTLERTIGNYNALGYKIGVIPRTGPNAGGIEYEIDFVNPVEHGRTWLASRPDQLVRINLRHDVKNGLAKLREELGAQVHEHQDNQIQLGELLDQAIEALNDKKEELEGLDAKLDATIEQFDEVRVTTTAETSAANAQAETLERDLATMRISAQNGLIQLDQKLQSTSMEYEQLHHDCAAARDAMTRDVVTALNEVIQFKVHIQTSLEALSEEVDDLEKERAATGAAD
ncbi:kinetochore-associated Ndc80 complex subunit ndc80 [Savitreella phatthalungensis]